MPCVYVQCEDENKYLQDVPIGNLVQRVVGVAPAHA